ncbi:MAG: hypothetical protein HRU17_11870 [Polyangiaceae bacterium]|nr:hypothetical protein [Polyangiaceae bacterium]
MIVVPYQTGQEVHSSQWLSLAIVAALLILPAADMAELSIGRAGHIGSAVSLIFGCPTVAQAVFGAWALWLFAPGIECYWRPRALLGLCVVGAAVPAWVVPSDFSVVVNTAGLGLTTAVVSASVICYPTAPVRVYYAMWAVRFFRGHVSAPAWIVGLAWIAIQVALVSGGPAVGQQVGVYIISAGLGMVSAWVMIRQRWVIRDAGHSSLRSPVWNSGGLRDERESAGPRAVHVYETDVPLDVEFPEIAERRQQLEESRRDYEADRTRRREIFESDKRDRESGPVALGVAAKGAGVGPLPPTDGGLSPAPEVVPSAGPPPPVLESDEGSGLELDFSDPLPRADVAVMSGALAETIPPLADAVGLPTRLPPPEPVTASHITASPVAASRDADSVLAPVHSVSGVVSAPTALAVPAGVRERTAYVPPAVGAPPPTCNHPASPLPPLPRPPRTAGGTLVADAAPRSGYSAADWGRSRGVTPNKK